MKALSIRQPWAWLIVEGHKDIENRNWDGRYVEMQCAICPVGSNVLIHASQGMTKAEYAEAKEFVRGILPGLMIPAFDNLKRGGSLGMVAFSALLRESGSKWFTGPVGLHFTNPYPLPFRPCRGALGFFEIEAEP